MLQHKTSGNHSANHRGNHVAPIPFSLLANFALKSWTVADHRLLG
jgi:hypothetical protein